LAEITEYLRGEECERVRLAALTESGARCIYCGHQPGDLAGLRVRSRWEFNDRTLTQRLVAVASLCPACDEARAVLATSDPTAADGRLALAHLAQRNRWTREEAIRYVTACQELAQLRSAQDWSLDLEWLRTIDIVLPGLDARTDLDQTYLPARSYNAHAAAQASLSVQLSKRPPLAALGSSRPAGPLFEDAHAYARTERVPLEIDLGAAPQATAMPIPEQLAPQFAALTQDAGELWQGFVSDLGPARRFPEALAFLDGELPLWRAWAYLEPRATLEPAFVLHLLVRAVQRAATALATPWRTREPEYGSNLPADAQRLLPGLPIWRDPFFVYETARFRSSRTQRPAVRLVTALWRLPVRARRVLRDLRRLDSERLRLCGESPDLEIQTRFALLLPGSLHEAAERATHRPGRTAALPLSFSTAQRPSTSADPMRRR